MSAANLIPLMYEFEVFKKLQDKLASEHLGEFVVIKGDEILGTYSTLEEAFDNTSRTYKPGTFLIQQCFAGEEAYTAIYHSRLI